MVVEPVRNYRGYRMAQRRRGGKCKQRRSAASSERTSSCAHYPEMLIDAAFHLFSKRSMRGPFRVPQSGSRMNSQSGVETLQLRPKRIIVGMGEVVALEEHRPDEGAAKARHLRSPAQLFDRVVHVLYRNHRRCEETVWSNLAEIRDPVVVGARESISHVWIFYQVESFSEPGGIQESLI